MANIKALLNQLKKEFPAVADSPILDEIESAYDGEEADESQDESDEAAAGMGDDAGGASGEDEGADAEAASAPAVKKKPKMPWM